MTQDIRQPLKRRPALLPAAAILLCALPTLLLVGWLDRSFAMPRSIRLSHEWVLVLLAAFSAISIFFENTGVPLVLNLTAKGDLKRETRWVAQYGQAACTFAIAAVIVQMDNERRFKFLLSPCSLTLVTVFGTSFLCLILKRLLGRVRPGHDDAGQFLGPSWKHANYRESFPSSHSACAVALSVTLAHLYPPAALTFWVLGLVCAVLRYVMDAHWPADVLAGIALGYTTANIACLVVMGA